MNKVSVQSAYPLSPMQAGMLFQTLIDRQSYCNQLGFEIQGQLDTAAFTQAWEQIVQRHSALRTAFLWQGRQQILQIVYSWIPLQIRKFDWSSLEKEKQKTQTADFRREDMAAGFDLSLAPLFRLALIWSSDSSCMCVFTFHHAILDATSLRVLLHEFLEFYNALAQGRKLELTPALPYRDYIAWLGRQDWARAENFWRGLLKGFSPVNLIEHATRTSSGFGHYELPLCSSREQDYCLVEFVRQHHITLNTLIQTAWALLLRRYLGTNDVICGTVVLGRPYDLPGAESAVGLFINTIPLRASGPASLKLIDFLHTLQRQQIEAREYQYCSLIDVQRWSGLPAGVPLFETIVSFDDYPVKGTDTTRAGSINLQASLSNGQTNVPLTLSLMPGRPARVAVDYDLGKWAETEIVRLLMHFRTLTENMLLRPDLPIGSIELLDEAEKRQILTAGQGEKITRGPRDYLHSWFEEQAQLHPQLVAAVHDGLQWSYGELNARANQVAHYLNKRGVGPEELVGVCAGRSFDLLVAILGILKAGGAYVPLDPAYPRSYLAGILQDSKVRLVLTQEIFLSALPNHKAEIVCLDKDWSQFAKEPESNSGPRATGSNLAYVLFTSGSSGRPKGVAVEHQGVCTLLCWMQSIFTADDLKGMLFSTSVCFDVSVFEIFAPLSVGGKLIITKNAISQPSAKERAEINIVSTVPSALAELVRTNLIAESVRSIAACGEPLATSLTQQIYENTKVQRIYNFYGPTEDTVFSTWSLVPPDTRVTIGRPGVNKQACVVGPDLQLSPVNVPGELCLAGNGLARGYYGCPDLTSDRFVPNPFCSEGGSRMYRTGDLCRWLPDGNIEFLGRMDNQLKLRGFRIELGEIEAVLKEHPQVRSAAVVEQGTKAHRCLVAYIVPAEVAIPSAEQMRQFLIDRLPAHMIPARFASLAALPFTANGKIDRTALARSAAELLSETPFTPPTSSLEISITAIWQEILGIENPGIHRNFFEVGGNSLLAIRLHEKLQELAGTQIPLLALFEHSTIHSFAVYLNNLNTGVVSEEVSGAGHRAQVRSQRVAASAEARKSRRAAIPASLVNESASGQ